MLNSNRRRANRASRIHQYRKLSEHHRPTIVRATLAKDAILVLGKGVIAAASLSFFMLVNALYTAGMGLARYFALKMQHQCRAVQIRSYRAVGIIICIASLCYVLYAMRLFFGGRTGDYSLYMALVIALYTFVEFGINLKETWRLRNSHQLQAKALRAIGFSGTLLCFVLTQTAIMSFAAQGDNRIPNALAGVIFGSLAAVRGLFVIKDSYRCSRSAAK